MDAKKRKEMSGRSPLVSFRIRRKIQRPAPELVRRYADFLLCDISDQVGRFSNLLQGYGTLLGPQIGPLRDQRTGVLRRRRRAARRSGHGVRLRRRSRRTL